MQAFSDPSRESEPYALPDVEIWEDKVSRIICSCGGDNLMPGQGQGCPECFSLEGITYRLPQGDKYMWWYWFCFPGCLPDSDAVGPFKTYDEALEDARGESHDSRTYAG